MKTLYINMGIALQQKLQYMNQLFLIGSGAHKESAPYNVLVMSYTAEQDKGYKELILNVKYSLGFDFCLFEKGEEISKYSIWKRMKDGHTKWIAGRNHYEGITNLWKALSSQIIVIKKGDEAIQYQWNPQTKRFNKL